MSAGTESAPSPRSRRARRIAFLLALLALAFVLVQTLLVGVYVVDGSSMEPTLHAGDRLLVWKAARAFARGDLVVFEHPQDDERVLVKRVAGLPGERIEIRAGRVYVDDRELGEPYLVRDEDRSPSLSRAPEVVPPGCYYALGDNRANSQDSRTFGPLEGSRIVGRALAVAWPPRRIR